MKSRATSAQSAASARCRICCAFCARRPAWASQRWARVTQETWIACAVADDIGFGLSPGGHLDVNTTLCLESRRGAGADRHQPGEHRPRLPHPPHAPSVPHRKLRIGADRARQWPVFRQSVRHRPEPGPGVGSAGGLHVQRFADIIALQLESELQRQEEHAALLDERRRARTARTIHRHPGS